MKINMDEEKFALIICSIIAIPLVILVEALLIWILSLTGFFIGGLLFIAINGVIVARTVAYLQEEGIIEFSNKEDEYNNF